MLIGYLYGIKSERRLVEEVQLNIAYRWFCGFELDDTIPNHFTFSKTRTRKWQQSSLFQKAFYEIVKQCIDSGLIDGEAIAADGSYIPANVSRESWINVETEVEQSMQSYLDSLDEELFNQPGFKKPPTKIVRKCRTTSQTDPDSGYINHGSKRGIGYLMEATVDCKHGILTGVDVYILPWILLRSTAGRIHLSGRSSSYVPQAKLQQIDGQISAVLPGRGQCLYALSKTLTRLEFGAECWPAFYRGHQRVGTPEYLSMMRLRKIWAEGSFSVLKREHCISKIRKRGILAATEECLLAAMALNLKRMAKCHLSLSHNLLFCWGHCGFQQFFCFCQQVQILTAP